MGKEEIMADQQNQQAIKKKRSTKNLDSFVIHNTFGVIVFVYSIFFSGRALFISLNIINYFPNISDDFCISICMKLFSVLKIVYYRLEWHN